MTRYSVHIYREMRLVYVDIEADTPEAAAAIASGKPTDDADNIEDCEGRNLTALIDVVGDEDFSQSVTIDFEPERQRAAASTLLAALEAVLPFAESERASLFECWRRDGESALELEAERCAGAIEKATVAIAAAKEAGIASVSTIGAAALPIVVVKVGGGLIDDVSSTIPVHVVIADWDVPDEETGKKPTQSVWTCAADLSGPRAEKLRGLIANA